MAEDENAGLPGGGDARVEREREFFDAKSQRYSVVRKRISRAIGALNRSDEVHSCYDPRGKRVLDYGCGEGRFSFRLLDRGAAHVTGIDISEARIAAARAEAAELGVGDRTAFMTADAHHSGLPPASFDLIIGSDILHHLDIADATAELRRLLKPQGQAIFVEPLAHHPLLRLGRRITPSARTTDEHPLTEDDWRLIDRTFPNFVHREVEFISIPLMPLNLVLPERAQQGLAARVAPLDDRILDRFGGLRKYARRTILLMGA